VIGSWEGECRQRERAPVGPEVRERRDGGEREEGEQGAVVCVCGAAHVVAAGGEPRHLLPRATTSRRGDKS
jgi:hypothetical protein